MREFPNLCSYGLTGDVRWNCDSPEQAETFSRELAELMTKHKVDKIDICWSKFAPVPVLKPAPESAEDVARRVVFEDSSWYEGGDPDQLGAKGIDLEALARLISEAIEQDRKERP